MCFFIIIKIKEKERCGLKLKSERDEERASQFV